MAIISPQNEYINRHNSKMDIKKKKSYPVKDSLFHIFKNNRKYLVQSLQHIY